MTRKFSNRSQTKYILICWALAGSITACGGGGSAGSVGGNTSSPDPTPTTPETPVQNSAPPVTPPTTPATTFRDPVIDDVERVVLRHVHRNAFSFPIDFNGEYIDSVNGEVEIRGPLDIYLPAEQNGDGTWNIEPESNGLAYFRVINTKPNGSVRVHNFYGVPVGHYITFDSTDVPNDIPASTIESECRTVDVQVNMATTDTSFQNLQINGYQRSRSSDSTNTETRIEDIQLCAVNGDFYFLMATFESAPGVVQYGFNYYEQLSDDDLLELNLDFQSDTIPWTSNISIDNEFTLSAKDALWATTQRLFSGRYSDSDPRLIPVFTELNVDSFVFSSSDGISLGQRSFTREFSASIQSLDLTLNDIVYEDVALSPLGIAWQSLGQDQAAVISGVVFNSQLTQTYAFMSMDPDIISAREFSFPLQDLELMLDSSFILMNGTAPAADSGNLNYLTTAGIYSGFIYLPNGITDHRNFNSDHLISVNISETLETLILQVWEQIVAGWEAQQNQN